MNLKPAVALTKGNEDNEGRGICVRKPANKLSTLSVCGRTTKSDSLRLRTPTERIQLLDLTEIDPDLFGITPLSIQQRCDAAFDVESKDFFHGFG